MGEKDIERMIQESMGQNLPEAGGEKPIDTESMKTDEEKALEGLSEQDKEVKSANELADLGDAYARKIQMAFESKGAKNLDAITKEYLAEAKSLGKTEDEARAVLRGQLKEFHDSYFAAGLKEKASEIDAFSRSLEAKSDVTTEAGKQFLADLDSNGFGSIETAINALNDVKEKSKGVSEEQINAEFNVLYAKINEHFLGDAEGKKSEKMDFGDDDIDSALGGL